MASQPPIIVIVTFTEVEADAVVATFKPEGLGEPESKNGINYFNLGVHGGHQLYHTMSDCGPGAAQNRVKLAIDHWSPKACVAVGIAFGMKSEHKGVRGENNEAKLELIGSQKLGDVLVAKQVKDYDMTKLRADGNTVFRGVQQPAADKLMNRLVTTNTMPKSKKIADWPKLHFGLILSGSDLINNLKERKKLEKHFEDAIGGEMEGGGLAFACQNANTDWALLKGICDFADGHKGDDHQKEAAMNAAYVLKTALTTGNSSIYPVTPPPATQEIQ